MNKNEIILTQEQKDYLKYLKVIGVAGKASDEVVLLFLKQCSDLKLNPMNREIYLVPYGNTYQPIIGFQTFLSKAYESGLMEYHNNVFTKEINIFTGKQDIVCTTIIKRKDSSKEHVTKIYLSEWNKENKMWQEKPQLMLEKCGLANAFRKAFPERFGNFPYTADELWFKTKNETIAKQLEEEQQSFYSTKTNELIEEYKEKFKEEK